jgi:hypothetical protein
MVMILRPLAASILSLALVAAFATPVWSQAEGQEGHSGHRF